MSCRFAPDSPKGFFQPVPPDGNARESAGQSGVLIVTDRDARADPAVLVGRPVDNLRAGVGHRRQPRARAAYLGRACNFSWTVKVSSRAGRFGGSPFGQRGTVSPNENKPLDPTAATIHR